MRLFHMLRFRLRALFDRDAVNREMEDELRFHIERETAENIRRGMNAEDARRAAHAAFGGVERFKEDLRDQRQTRWMDDIASDVRHGFRLLRKNRLFSAAVIVTLALGIGATSTIFAIVNGVLLRPLPYVDAGRIVALSERDDGRDFWSAGQRAFSLWEQANQSFSTMAVFSQSSAILTGAGEPFELNGGAGTQALFDVFGAKLLMGRTFVADDYAQGAPRVVVLSAETWRNNFGGDPDIVGRAIEMNERRRTVIGVMASGFEFPQKAKYWVPLVLPNDTAAEFHFGGVARLRDGVSVEQAQADLNRLQPLVHAQRSALNRTAVPAVVTLHERLFGSVQKPLSILLGAVIVLLFIACANVANLTLARSASRHREFAVRLALGAGRWRLVRQLLVESSILAALGGALGAVMPVFLVGAFVRLSPGSVAGVSDIRVDGTVLLFTALTSLVAAVVFGLAPALTGARSGTGVALSSGSARAGQSRGQRAMRSSLVVLEVSAALTLVTGAALLTKSFAQAISVNPGFDSEHLFASRFSLPGTRYPDDTQIDAFYSAVAAQLSVTPGVEGVSLSGSKPLDGYTFSRRIARHPGEEAKSEIFFTHVDSNYAKTVGLRLIAGRFLDSRDVKGAPAAVMITKTAANLLFDSELPIGKAIPQVRGDTQPPMIVVGVVEDVVQRALDAQPVPGVFQSMAQVGDAPRIINIRASLEPSVLREHLRRIVSRIDAQLPLTTFFVLGEEVTRSVAPRKFNSVLINAFAMLALVLAMIGLYGLMAHSVAMRTRELGIRIALGAQPENVLALVLRQGANLLVIGVVLGVAISLALSRMIASLLYNVPARDPIVFVGAPLMLSLVGLIACWVPARRATTVDPVGSLRQE